MMKCKTCGTDVTGQKFCTQCGEKIELEMKSKKKVSKKLIASILVGVVGISGGGYAYYLYNNADGLVVLDKKNEEGTSKIKGIFSNLSNLIKPEPKVVEYDWEVLVEPMFYYDYWSGTPDFNEQGLLVVQIEDENGKYGIIDKNGEFVLPPIYDEIQGLNITDVNDHVVAMQNNRQMIINIKKNMVVDTIRAYDDIRLISDELAIVAREGMYGLLNYIRDEELIPLKYTYLNNFGASGFFFAQLVRESAFSNMGVVNLEGQTIIPFEYDWIEYTPMGFVVMNDNSASILDLNGQRIIPMEFQGIKVFSEEILLVQYGGLWGVMNRKGEWLVPNIYDHMQYIYGEDLISVITINGEWKEIDPRTWKEVEIEKDNNVFEYIWEDEYGIDRTVGIKNTLTGEMIIPLGIYSHIEDNRLRGGSNYAIVTVGYEENRKQGIVDISTGELVFNPIYTEITMINEHIIKLVSGGAVGLNMYGGYSADGGTTEYITIEGQPSLIKEFDDYVNDSVSSESNLIRIMVGENSIENNTYQRWGLVNEKGEEILPVIYDLITGLTEKFYKVRKGGVLEPSPIGHGDFPSGGEMGIIDMSGNIVVPVEMPFDDVFYLQDNNVLMAKRDSKFGLVKLIAK